MKWIFYLLLLVNLGLVAWMVNAPKQQEATSKQKVRDVGDLKIVSDVELQVRADFQRDMDQELKKQARKPVAGKVDEELPHAEFDEFVFDEEDAKQPVCRQLGPFAERGDASNIAAGLAAYRLVTKLVSDTSTKTTGYWAIIPAPTTLDESSLLIEKLKDKGLTDVRRFSSGSLENAISLGLFSSEGNAIKRARSVEQLGFVTLVKPKTEQAEFYWLEYMQPPGFNLPIKGVRNNFPEVQIQPCPGIAKG